jgi:tRNA G18 (ribose-2'-O)-methylase SpoU
MKKITGSKLKKFNKKNKPDREIILVLDNLEYARNVASIFNLAFALRVENIFLTGITTTPPFGKELQKVSKRREEHLFWKKEKNLSNLIEKFKSQNITTIALAKTEDSIKFDLINSNQIAEKVAIIVGNEKQGLSNKLLSEVDIVTIVPVFRPLAHLNVVNELAVLAYKLV